MSIFEELKRRNVFRVGVAYGVTAWLLIQITDTVFPRIGLSESAVTLVIALLGIGFVPALIFAWAFEMTPEGIKREREVNRDASITPQTGKKLDRVIIAVLAVMVAWLLIDKYYLDAGEGPAGVSMVGAKAPDAPMPEEGGPVPDDNATAATDGKSIAVLPFVNMSADADNEYFSDGIAEELLNVLVRVSALEVASRTSSFAYKGKELPLSQVARELGVNHILEGSVRKAGNRVRITAQLIDAGSDRHLWSDTYERQLDDIFEIQEEISGHIVDALKIALDVGEAAAIERLQRPTDNTEAYELYLQGRFKWRQRLEGNLRTAIDLFERAIELDPDFAKAHEALASTFAVLPAWSAAKASDTLPRADQSAARALELDPTLAEARSVRAHFAGFELRWQEALKEFETAIDFEPHNGGVRQWYAELLANAGYSQAALEQIEEAYRLDPASPVINNVYNHIAVQTGEDELSLRHMRIASDLGIELAVYTALPALLRQGDWKTIEDTLIPLAQRRPPYDICIEAHRDASLYPKLQAALEAHREAGGFGMFDVYCAALAGDLDGAFQDLARLLEEDPANIGNLWGLTPVEKTLRRDDRFKLALRDVRLVDLYRQRGWPNHCRPLGGEDFECE